MLDFSRRKAVTSLVVLLTASVMGCSSAGDRAASDADAPPQLTMATSPDYPPYEFYDTSGGSENIVGFDIDIANYIADELGYELTVRGMDFSGLIPALQAERVDFVMAGMTPTEERKENADFSTIYFEAQNTIVAKAEADFDSIDDLSEKKVGVQLGTIQEGVANDFKEEDVSIEVVSLNKIGEIVQELKSGRLDAAIIEDTIAKGFVDANPDLAFNVIPDDGPSGSAIAFPKDSELVEDFDRVLADMQSNGEMERLVLKWFSEGVTEEEAE